MNQEEIQSLLELVTPETKAVRQVACEIALSVFNGSKEDSTELKELRDTMSARAYIIDIKLLEKGIDEDEIAHIKYTLCETFEDFCKPIVQHMTPDQRHQFKETMQVAFGVDISQKTHEPEAALWRERIAKLIPSSPGGHQL